MYRGTSLFALLGKFLHAMVEQEKSFEYNGWKGNGDSLASARFTWLTALWLSNDPFLDEQLHEIANLDMEAWEAGNTLRTWVEEVVVGELIDAPGMAADYVRSILHSEVNWTEIVESFRES